MWVVALVLSAFFVVIGWLVLLILGFPLVDKQHCFEGEAETYPKSSTQTNISETTRFKKKKSFYKDHKKKKKHMFLLKKKKTLSRS